MYIAILYVMFQSYSMRNSILGVLGEMVMRVLSREDLSDIERNTRDQFLDKLEVPAFGPCLDSVFEYNVTIML